jgi:hypothetical protein
VESDFWKDLSPGVSDSVADAIWGCETWRIEFLGKNVLSNARLHELWYVALFLAFEKGVRNGY